jgi:hypothetical protein
VGPKFQELGMQQKSTLGIDTYLTSQQIVVAIHHTAKLLHKRRPYISLPLALTIINSRTISSRTIRQILASVGFSVRNEKKMNKITWRS